ncbi:hypothetical protein K8N77_001130 [Salmonella enterica]|nr:hypothetical protein [Salmonella enterica]
MKVLSYSRMRAELADVLDCLRNGETVTITQKGKDDLILYSDKGQVKINTRLTGSSGVASAIAMTDKLDKLPGGGVKLSKIEQAFNVQGLKAAREAERICVIPREKRRAKNLQESLEKGDRIYAAAMKALEDN